MEQIKSSQIIEQLKVDMKWRIHVLMQSINKLRQEYKVNTIKNSNKESISVYI